MKLKDARIIFMGTSFFAKEILSHLLTQGIKINLVVTQPDKLAGRKKKPQPSEVKTLAKKEKLELARFEKLDQVASEKIEKLKPDLIIVAAYGMIIPANFIEKVPYGFVNVHASLLPKLRGASPIQTALLQGLEKTGVTIMKINPELDAGDILTQKEISINPADTHPILEKKLIKASNEILVETLDDYLSQKIKPQPQDHSQATFTRIIKKEDGRINWNSPAKDIYNKFRAYYRWPQIYTFWSRNGNLKKITLTEIDWGKGVDENKKVGEVYKNKDQILVRAKTGSIVLKKIKIEGKGETPIKNFLNGYPDFIGCHFTINKK